MAEGNPQGPAIRQTEYLIYLPQFETTIAFSCSMFVEYDRTFEGLGGFLRTFDPFLCRS